MESNPMIMRTISESVIILHLLGTGWVQADFDTSLPEFELEATCQPIVPLPSSPFTAMRQKMLDINEFELAILETSLNSDKYFWSYVIRKVDTDYICYIKRIKAEEVLKDNKIDPILVAKCSIDLKSRAIDGNSVKILAEALRHQVSKAKYQTKMPAYAELDGTTYEVFVKGAPKDLYSMYAGEVNDGYKRSSHSCSTIAFALTHLVLSEDDKSRTKPLNKLIKYLKSVVDGNPDGVDPFLEKEEPAPDIELPPI